MYHSPRLKGCVSELSALCENSTLFKVKELHACKTRSMLCRNNSKFPVGVLIIVPDRAEIHIVE